jgi:pimeloyl-ACP methyl ester carboxylesterase
MKKTLLINGHSIYVETHGPGDGLPVVLLHHGLGAVRSWKEQIPVLAEAGYRVIAYDRWGHGKSGLRETYAMPDFKPDLADLEILLGCLDLEQFALIGHSDGGKLAMYYTASHRERVSCLVIVSAHIFVEPDLAPGIQSVRRDFEQDSRFQVKMRRVHGDKAQTLFWGWYQGWTRPEVLEWDLRPTISSISCPTLVVQGQEDEHISPAQAQQLAGIIATADLWLIPEAGHMLPQDFPEEFNPKLLEFLAVNYSVNSANRNV